MSQRGDAGKNSLNVPLLEASCFESTGSYGGVLVATTLPSVQMKAVKRKTTVSAMIACSEPREAVCLTVDSNECKQEVDEYAFCSECGRVSSRCLCEKS